MESNFVDFSLPPGWTVKERIRENGKRDKYYYAPKNGPVFNSKVKVYHYLNKAKGKKNKLALKRPWKIVSVEKTIVEDLPLGWTREIRVKEKDQTIRRDQYYVDPVTRTKFRSLKAIYRHLAIEVSSVSANGNSVETRTRGRIDRDQSCSDMDAIIDKGQRSEYLDDLSPSNESEKARLGSQKSEKTKALVLPRRSKRLAGIEVDPIGLTPKTRPCRVVEPSMSDESVHQHHSSRSDTIVYFPDNSVTSVIGCEEKHESVSLSRGFPLGEFLSDPCIAFAIKTLTGLTFDDLNTSSDRTTSLFRKVKSEEDDEIDAKQGQSDTAVAESSSFMGPWKDPCIEFAIKTLTDTAQLDYTTQHSQQHQMSFPKTPENSNQHGKERQ